jgi:ribosome-associated translation inhibitor RaiA
MTDEEVQLGGNIQLVGFHDIDKAELIVVKKMVGQYSRKFSDRVKGFESLRLILKAIHKREKSEKYELTGKIFIHGKQLVATAVDQNLFFTIDNVLKKLEEETERL